MDALESVGISVSHRIIGDALKVRGFSLQFNRKRFEGKSHPDRDNTIRNKFFGWHKNRNYF